MIILPSGEFLFRFMFSGNAKNNKKKMPENKISRSNTPTPTHTRARTPLHADVSETSHTLIWWTLQVLTKIFFKAYLLDIIKQEITSLG